MLGPTRPRILIVEDDLLLAEMYQRVLEPLAEAHIVERVDQVFELLLDLRPAAILLDLRLERERVHPIEDAGLHILARLRHSRVACDLPVIVATALEDQATKARCHEMGIVAYLVKPVGVDKLRAAVEMALARQQRRVLIVSTLPGKAVKAARWVVKGAVEELGECLRPILVDELGASPEPAEVQVRQVVAESDLLALVLGKKYGRLLGPEALALTEHAYNQARALGRPVLVFAQDVSHREPRLEAFLIRAGACHCVQTFQDLEHLREEALKALRGLSALAGPSGAEQPAATRPGIPVRDPGEHRRPTRPVRVLMLASNPRNTDRLRLGEECREIDQALRDSALGQWFELRQAWAVRIGDLQGHLMRYRPDVVHFSGHGSPRSEIVLEDKRGRARVVSPTALGRVFGLLHDNIRCVVLNACFSEKQAQAIAEHIECVVGMSREVNDAAAIAFATAFYRALGYGRDVRNAFELGRTEVEMEVPGEQEVPCLFAPHGSPETLVFV